MIEMGGIQRHILCVLIIKVHSAKIPELPKVSSSRLELVRNITVCASFNDGKFLLVIAIRNCYSYTQAQNLSNPLKQRTDVRA